jgi:hypothetical protein
MVIRTILIFFLIATPVWGYDIITAMTDPDDEGTIVMMHGTAEQTVDAASVPQRWKTVHVQADSSATVTHFLIRIATSSSNSLPVGFAVYASTGSGSGNPPGDTPLIRGYLASYQFSSTGWYALPFLNDATLAVTSGTWYHLTFMINENAQYADPNASRISSGYDSDDKWFPDCGGTDCEYDEPPGVGSEPTYASENNYQTSAGWQAGLFVVDAEESSKTIQGVSIQ